MKWMRGALFTGIVVVAAGCNLSSDVPRTRPVGVIRMVIQGDSENGYTTKPTAAFLQVGAIGLPNSDLAPDACVDSTYTLPGVEEPLMGNIGAGESITAKSDLETASLTASATSSGTLYSIEGNAPLKLTPGKAVTYTIPGDPAGFPAMTLDAATVAPFTLGPIDPNPESELRLTWAPVQGGNTAVVISLQYSSSPTSSTADRQIYCSVRDDGSFTVPTEFVGNWKNSSASARRATAYRWRTSFTSLNSALLLSISHYDAPPKTTFP
jgi:hypothetical protein